MNVTSPPNLAISSAKTQRGASSVHVRKGTSFKKMGEAAKVYKKQKNTKSAEIHTNPKTFKW